MNYAASHMSMLREGWKSIGFQPVTLYVHENDLNMFKGNAYEQGGDRLLSILPTLSHDQLLHLVDRKAMSTPNLGDVAIMRRKLEGANAKIRKRFEAFSNELTDYLVLKRRYETLDFPDDATMLYSGAEMYARSYKLYGSWLILNEWYSDL